MTATSTARPAREYETIYVLRPDVAKDAAQRVATRIEEAVTRENGKLTQVETWGRRQLAYPVRKLRRGVYVYVKYVGGGALVTEIERNLRMIDEVLKFQTVQVRAEVDTGALQIDPEGVRFEAIEPPAEAEEELSRERELGLVDPPEGASRRREPEDEFENYGAGDEED